MAWNDGSPSGAGPADASMIEDRSAWPDPGSPPGSIALLGIGLIGGSIARALRGRGAPTRLVAWTPSGAGPRAALTDDAVDAVAGSVSEAVAGVELVILAGPPLAIIDLIQAEAGVLGDAASGGATLTDVASTKAAILAAADRGGLPFVGGHPMAGREAAGFAAADAGLFRDRPWVVVPGAHARDRDVERVERLVHTLGARPVRLSAEQHDTAVAAVSHVPLVASAALVEAAAASPDWPAARRLAASGWVSMTRLARGDPEMGAGILATNRAEVLRSLRAYRDAIDAWIAALDAAEPGGRGDEVARLRSRLEAAWAVLGADGDG